MQSGCVQRPGVKGLSKSMAAVDTQLRASRGLGMMRGNSILRESVALCNICVDRPASCVLMPCKHENLCMKCANNMTQCPFCRTQIASRDLVKSATAVQV